MNNPLYLNRILVYPSLGKCDVSFRQGLNVVLSEDILELNKSEDVNDQKELRNTRNSTGKTTLIHLIDYMLGKTDFVRGTNREEVGVFKEHHAMVEICIYNEKYTVVRSILENEVVHRYDGWVIDELIAGNPKQLKGIVDDKDGYVSFLEKEIFKGVNYFKDKKIVSYRSIMNYINRDQFAGYTKYYTGLKDENAKFCRERIEFLYGLTTEEKLNIKDEIIDLENQKKILNTKHKILKDYIAETLSKRKTEILKDIKKNTKDIDKWTKELTICNNRIEQIQVEKSEERDAKQIVEDQLTQANNNIMVIKARMNNYITTLNETQFEIDKLESIILGINVLGEFDIRICPLLCNNVKGQVDQIYTCPYIDMDEEKINKDVKIVDARRLLLEYEKKDLERALLSLESQLEYYEKEVKELVLELDEYNKVIDTKTHVLIIERDMIRDSIKELEYQNRVLEDQVKQYEYLDKLAEDKKEKQDSIKLKKAELDALDVDVKKIGSVYNNIVNYISQNSRDGKISTKNFEPCILFKNGQIDGGAGVNSIAIIAFDLTMLTFSLIKRKEGLTIPYMDFLIHDSPKRNDIDLEMYKRIFDYIILLEEKYLKDEIGFQYIITTLDISEKVIKNRDKYVRLTLDNSGEGGKLFGITINI